MTDGQNKVDWLDTFRAWFGERGKDLSCEGITVDLPVETHGNGIYADLKSGRHEATVQLWDNGLSDFHVLDWRAADLDPDYQVKVTHHEFQSEGELFAALDGLVRQLSPTPEREAVSRTPTVTGRA